MTRHLSGLRRWALRCQVMALVSLQFWYSNFQRMADFFRQVANKPSAGCA